MALKYWVGGTGPWTGSGVLASRVNWSNSSGGPTGAIAPGGADDVRLDANSGVGTITISATVQMRSIGATAYLGTLTGSGNMQITGSNTGLPQGSGKTIEFGPTGSPGLGMTYSYAGAITLSAGNGSGSINLNGQTHGGNIQFNGAAGLWTLANPLVMTGTLTLSAGSFTTNNYNVTCSSITVGIGALARSLSLGSSVVTLTNNASVWAFGTTSGVTLNAGTSTIIATNNSTNTITFAGGGLTYYNVEFARATGSGQITLTGSNTFFNFIDNTSTAAHTISFATSVSFTNTFQNFDVRGSSTSARITLSGGTAGANFIKSTTGGIFCEYLNLGNNTTSVTPANTWYAGYFSIGTGAGWVLQPPSGLMLLGVG